MTWSQRGSLVPDIRHLHWQSSPIRLLRVTGFVSKSIASYNTIASRAGIGSGIIKTKQKEMDDADAYAPAEKDRQRGNLFGFVSFEYHSRQLEPSKHLD